MRSYLNSFCIHFFPTKYAKASNNKEFMRVHNVLRLANAVDMQSVHRPTMCCTMKIEKSKGISSELCWTFWTVQVRQISLGIMLAVFNVVK